MSTDIKIADLTVEQLTTIIQKVVEQTILETLGDPDVGLALRDDVKARLERSLEVVQTDKKTIPAQDAAAKLGLEW